MPGRPLLKKLDVESAAVFRALQLGDMLCAVPALRALRGALPGVRIALVGLPWAGAFARRFSRYIDEFIAFPGHPAFPEQPVDERQQAPFYETMQARGFTLALQMHGSGDASNSVVQTFRARATAGYTRGGAVPGERDSFFPYPDEGAESSRLLRLAELIGAPARGANLEFPLTEADWDELNASGLAASLIPGSYACIHPGARLRDKCWPPELFAEVADHLANEFGVAIVLTGSDRERDLTCAVARAMRMPSINAAAPISVGAMAALMSGARLLVCNDTGVSHIAAGLNLKSVVIFSKADIVRWAPLDHQRHRCINDPAGEQAGVVLEHARMLLAGVN